MVLSHCITVCTVRANAEILDRHLTVILICVRLKSSTLTTYAVCGDRDHSVLLNKVYPSDSCYLLLDIQIVDISYVFQKVAVSGTCKCPYFHKAQSLVTVHSSHKPANTGATETQRILQPLRVQRHFIGLYFWNEATQTTCGIILELRSSGLLHGE